MKQVARVNSQVEDDIEVTYKNYISNFNRLCPYVAGYGGNALGSMAKAPLDPHAHLRQPGK